MKHQINLPKSHGAPEAEESIRVGCRFAVTGDRRSILLALFEEGYPVVSLRRAASLALVLDAELRVVRVLPELIHVNPFFPQASLLSAARAIERTLRVHRSTRDWLLHVLGDDSPEVHLQIRNGRFVDQVAALAAEANSELIVMPPRRRRPGAAATALARASTLPVLVARESVAERTIVAATDLMDSDFPVLHEAAELARRLDAQVVAVHNVAPVSTVSAIAVPWPVAAVPSAEETSERKERLMLASRDLPVRAEAILSHESSPVHAILQEARARDADLVVVGTRPRTWLDRLISGSIAARVVNRARSSVLVTPLTNA